MTKTKNNLISEDTRTVDFGTETRIPYHPKPSPRNPIRVFLAAENVTEVRRLHGLLSAKDILLIGFATSTSELEAAVHLRTDMDVLVTDIELHNNPTDSLILLATTQHPHLNVLCSTSCTDEQRVFSAIQHGATGYILKGTEDLAACIRLIYAGGSPVSPSVARSVLRTLFLRANGLGEWPRKHAEQYSLSDRELDVLRLLAKGISFAEIGTVLSISTHTVTAHIKKIYRKMQVHSRSEAVYEAQCLGLLRETMLPPQ